MKVGGVRVLPANIKAETEDGTPARKFRSRTGEGSLDKTLSQPEQRLGEECSEKPMVELRKSDHGVKSSFVAV